MLWADFLGRFSDCRPACRAVPKTMAKVAGFLLTKPRKYQKAVQTDFPFTQLFFTVYSAEVNFQSVSLSPSAQRAAGHSVIPNPGSGSLRGCRWPDFCGCRSGEEDANPAGFLRISQLQRHGVGLATLQPKNATATAIKQGLLTVRDAEQGAAP